MDRKILDVLRAGTRQAQLIRQQAKVRTALPSEVLIRVLLDEVNAEIDAVTVRQHEREKIEDASC